MFGPNTHLKATSNIDFSHRDKKFKDLLFSLRDLFTNKFNLHEYDLLFIPGSGTIGIESLIWSSVNQINVIGHKGSFTSRWLELSNYYNDFKSSERNIDFFCQLETSCGKYAENNGGFVDAVSSFPYFDLPECEAFVTCSNKLLGSMPGLAIVGVRKDSWNLFKDSSQFSYLNLSRYKKFSDIDQTPTTPAYSIMMHLHDVLLNFSKEKLRDRIHTNSEILNEVFKSNPSPVFVISKENINKEIAKKWDLYGLHTDSHNYSIFTYSCEKKKYIDFVKDIQNENIL